ncbi:MAG: hypothetical protein ACOZF2_18515 [Thermodesulfobacteriota bacterium]
MNTGHDWLTLAEVIRQGNLDDIETRRLVKKLGKLLAPRNFGDIVKYPAPVTDLLVRFNNLRQQGWTIGELKNLLIIARQEQDEDCQDRQSDLVRELQQESVTLLEQLEVVKNCGNCGSQLQGLFRTIENLTISVNVLIARILHQEEELSELRE